MKKTKKAPKPKPEYRWAVESEYGWDLKRRVATVTKTEEQAYALKVYLDLKDPYDKHTIIKLQVVG